MSPEYKQDSSILDTKSVMLNMFDILEVGLHMPLPVYSLTRLPVHSSDWEVVLLCRLTSRFSGHDPLIAGANLCQTHFTTLRKPLANLRKNKHERRMLHKWSQGFVSGHSAALQM